MYPFEAAFAKKLGRCEDVKEAAQAIGLTRELAEKALANSEVRSLVEVEHHDYIQKLVEEYKPIQELAEALVKRDELNLKVRHTYLKARKLTESKERLAKLNTAIARLRIRRDAKLWCFVTTWRDRGW
jgi:hypothetical protein